MTDGARRATLRRVRAIAGVRPDGPERRRRADPARRVRAEIERAAEALELRGQTVLAAVSARLWPGLHAACLSPWPGRACTALRQHGWPGPGQLVAIVEHMFQFVKFRMVRIQGCYGIEAISS